MTPRVQAHQLLQEIIDAKHLFIYEPCNGNCQKAQELGKQVRQIRQYLGISRSYLATTLQLDTDTIKALELGKLDPNQGQLVLKYLQAIQKV